MSFAMVVQVLVAASPRVAVVAASPAVAKKAPKIGAGKIMNLQF